MAPAMASHPYYAADADPLEPAYGLDDWRTLERAAHEGGYYAWVRRGMGNFWGFQEAWLSLVATIFDMAIYPTLFVLSRPPVPLVREDTAARWSALAVVPAARC